jgi:hypothetical protein
MSELTLCNYCTLQSMKQRAEKRGTTVVLGSDPQLPGWTAVRYADRDKPSSWFLSLTDHCVC